MEKKWCLIATSPDVVSPKKYPNFSETFPSPTARKEDKVGTGAKKGADNASITALVADFLEGSGLEELVSHLIERCGIESCSDVTRLQSLGLDSSGRFRMSKLGLSLDHQVHHRQFSVHSACALNLRRLSRWFRNRKSCTGSSAS